VRGVEFIEADPLFADPEHADFHLRADSPAIGAGSQERAPETDLEGAARPAGGSWDIGAYEFREGEGSQTRVRPPARLRRSGHHTRS
jgi:hypothetical protein